MRRIHLASAALSAGALSVAVALTACAPAPRTQVMVVVTADADVAAATEQLRVRVVDGESGQERFLDEIGSERQPVTFPLRIALVPSESASGTYRVEVTALDPAGALVVARSVSSGFLPRRTLRLPLPLVSCCRGVSCTAQETCANCRCGSTDVSPALLADLESDSGLPDAWSPPADAVTPDAAVPPDAAPCTIDCFDVADFTGGLNIAPPREDRRWAPPVGGCGGSLAPAADRGYRAIYLHNSGATDLTVRLTTLREPPPDPTVDLALVVYDVAAALPRWPLPADVRACAAYAADFPGIEPDARLDHVIRAGSTVQVVVTRETAGDIITPNVNIGVQPL